MCLSRSYSTSLSSTRLREKVQEQIPKSGLSSDYILRTTDTRKLPRGHEDTPAQRIDIDVPTSETSGANGVILSRKYSYESYKLRPPVRL
jgi:hypothetical protein